MSFEALALMPRKSFKSTSQKRSDGSDGGLPHASPTADVVAHPISETSSDLYIYLYSAWFIVGSTIADVTFLVASGTELRRNSDSKSKQRRLPASY